MSLWGQPSAGLVVVTVQDPSGAAIAGASVTITDETTSVAATQTAGVDGLARFVSVKPSMYTVAAGHAGFKRTARQHVTVNVAESVTLALTLEIGAVTETVEVTGAAPLLQTERGELGQVIGRQQIVDLPLNGRNAISLAGLTSGVIPGPAFSDGPLNLANISINGGRGGATEILQDGAPATVPENSPGTFATATLPSVERVQEFKVQTNSFSAEFGRTTGGIINLVVKSGTNQYHGSVYEYLRNSRLDSNDWFQNRAGRKLGVFQRNQYGLTLGGPVILPGLYNGRNRTFFFGGYEGQRQRNQQTSTATIPTAAEMGGDFSRTLSGAGQPVVIYDPRTTVRNAAGAFVRDPFPANRIPAARLDPVATRLFTFYPQPNTPGTGPANLNNFIAAGAGAIDDDNFDVRVDHSFAPSRNFYIRLSNRDFRQVNPNFYGTIGMPGAHIIPRPGQTAAVNYIQNVRPNLLSETTYGYARLFTNRQSHSFGVDINKELGLPPELAAISNNRGFPAITVAGYGAIGESFNARFSLESHTFLENLTYLRGKQSIKFGGQVRINRTNFFQGQFPAGTFAFNQAFTQGPDPTRATATGGNGIASMLLGLAASGAATHDSPVSTQSPYFGLFVQDDLKVSRSLTLNFGLRYDLEIPRSERYNRLSVFNPEVTSPIASRVAAFPNLKGGLEFLGKDREKQFFTDKNNLGPRFGFAWRGPRNLVFRGGYAIFFSASSATAAGTLGGGGNAGFTSRTVYTGSLDGGLTPADRLSNPFPRGFTLPFGSSLGLLSFLGLEFQTNDPADRTPYVQQWNFNIQKEVIAGLLVEASYAGSKGASLPSVFGSINQLRTGTLALGSALLDQVPNPFFGVITEPTSTLRLATVQRAQLLRPFPQFTTIALEKGSYGSSTYHSLQLRVDRRFRNGMSLLAGYTWSKLIDDISNSGTGLNGPFAYTQDWFNRRAERSLSVFDVAHRLVLSGTYELPVGKGRKFGSGMGRFADAVIGGWQVNGIATVFSGLPLFLSNSVNTSNSLGQLIGAGAPVNGTQRPNNNGQSARRSGPVVDRLTEYFTRAVFSQPPPFTHGNVARTLSDVRSPAMRNLDLSLFKNFRITEGIRLQVRAESFNFTNTPIFGGPGATFGVATLGVISAQGNNPRQIQFGMRLAF
ncbi:MAG: carboxypeptidase regulatory-like domain-containing protein [Acidobacteria bacterium]|nr:carboxypeptidase regulatory-like domain-containing protein [Acidobacteriota bacterium]